MFTVFLLKEGNGAMSCNCHLFPKYITKGKIFKILYPILTILKKSQNFTLNLEK